jgi:quinol monooxygenase YgiN
MAEKMILEIPVHAEKREEFIGVLNQALTETRAYEGCLTATVWTPEDDDGKVWVYEEWETRDNQAAYFNWRIESGMMDALAPFLDGEPRVIWLIEH